MPGVANRGGIALSRGVRSVLTISSAVSAIPLVSYGILLGCAARVALEVGHWPRYNQPDPHAYAVYTLGVFSALTGLVAVAIVPVVMVVLMAVGQTDGRGVRFGVPGMFTLYGIGAALWVIDFVGGRSGLGFGLVNWILD